MVLTTALIAALLLIACGQTSQRRMSFSVIQQSSINIADALAQLDARQAPNGVDPAAFTQPKAALRAALIAHGVDKVVSTPPTGPDNAVPDFAFTGALLLQQLWGGGLYDSPNRLAINNTTGDVFVAGGTTSFGVGDTDAFVLQYNDSGSLLKQVAWGGLGEDKALGLALGPDGALYMSGYSPDASSTWRTLSGAVTPGTGTAADVGGSFDDPGWVVFAIMEALTDRVGVIDTGGGYEDDLLVKANPSLF